MGGSTVGLNSEMPSQIFLSDSHQGPYGPLYAILKADPRPSYRRLPKVLLWSSQGLPGGIAVCLSLIALG